VPQALAGAMGPLPRLLLLASLVWGAGAQRPRAPHPPGYRPQLDSYANLTKYIIDDPLALCNDGTPGKSRTADRRVAPSARLA